MPQYERGDVLKCSSDRSIIVIYGKFSSGYNCIIPRNEEIKQDYTLVRVLRSDIELRDDLILCSSKIKAFPNERVDINNIEDCVFGINPTMLALRNTGPLVIRAIDRIGQSYMGYYMEGNDFVWQDTNFELDHVCNPLSAYLETRDVFSFNNGLVKQIDVDKCIMTRVPSIDEQTKSNKYWRCRV